MIIIQNKCLTPIKSITRFQTLNDTGKIDLYIEKHLKNWNKFHSDNIDICLKI